MNKYNVILYRLPSMPAFPKLFLRDPVIFMILLRDSLKLLSPILAHRVDKTDMNVHKLFIYYNKNAYLFKIILFKFIILKLNIK